MMTARSPYLLASARALAVSLALSSASAAAQPPPVERTAVAEALFQQARDLFKQANYAEACPKFAESQRLEPKLGVLLNLAVCHEKLGKIATAWAEYTSAAVIARREGGKEREDFARERVAALEKQLARVTIRMSLPPVGLSLTLDDQPLDRAALSTSLPIDPGQHTLTATAPGMIAWSTTITVTPERADLDLLIPALAVASAPAPTPVAALTPVATPVPTAVVLAPKLAAVEAPPPPRDGARVLMYAGFSVGTAGVLLGAITGIVTLTRAGNLSDKCTNGHCATDQTDTLSSVNTLANVSNVGFAVGAVGLGVGVGTLIWTRTREPATKTAGSITPLVGPGTLGLRGTF